MPFSYRQIVFFFTQKIWYVNESELSPVRRYVFRMMKKVVLTIECFLRRNINSFASALTFSSILAIVPILNILFQIDGKIYEYQPVDWNHIDKDVLINNGYWWISNFIYTNYLRLFI